MRRRLYQDGLRRQGRYQGITLAKPDATGHCLPIMSLRGTGTQRLGELQMLVGRVTGVLGQS